MYVLMLTASAWAGQTVVVVGQASVPGTWVPGLADCLEERKPGQYTVVDRRSADTSWTSLASLAPDIAALQPTWVIVEPPTTSAAPDWDALLAALAPTAPHVWIVAPRLRSSAANRPDPSDHTSSAQASADPNAESFAALSSAVQNAEQIQVVDPWQGWWKGSDNRRPDPSLTDASGHLTDQGYAKVAAFLCDAMLAQSSQ